ncbi:DNA-binding transcriptional regulator, AcrR family [Bosea sp. CRIB-10]|uniref:TetR/AcrR family transcriptional regulator n=1 Tax=Bosea sp. CRIB-10 TaxID=378404 RepID=UPI0008E7C70F|nr:TetR/AcrR family transcriptional regulator [Bosea sp. CRIB-10]SFC01737.1 DNA-binding transcriptional regulator, AcrR family [Bosea sp. CRIB-10]
MTVVTGRAERAELEGGARRLILDHAARLLRSNGYHQTSLREIAEAVGIRKASLYYHFRSKEEIVEAVVNDGVRLVHDAVLAALGAAGKATARERLKAAIAAHLAALHGHSDYTCASIKVFSFGENPTPESVRSIRRAYDDLWRALIDELASAGVLTPGIAPEHLRLFLLGAMNGSVDWYREGRFDIAQLAGELATLVATKDMIRTS